MAVINRIVAALFALILAAGALLTIALATGGLSPDRLRHLEQVRISLEKLPSMGTLPMVTVFLVALAVLLFAILLFASQFKRHATSDGYLVRDDEMGVFTVHPNAITAIAAHVGKAVPGVDSVACSSRQEPEGTLLLNCKVIFRPGVPLDRTAQTFRDEFKQETENMTGLAVGKLNVVAMYRSGRPNRDKRRFLA
jgi:hypothetical protein